MPIKFEKLSILIVEDEHPIQVLYSSVLESLNVGRIFTASSGEQGFDLFKNYNPDIVIADWHMEPVNGIELTKEIRTNSLSPNRLVPVILITGYSAENRVAEARDAGVTEFLVKPFSAADLAKRITYVINKPRDFVDAEEYFGPDRRRKAIEGYNGPKRREEDEQES